MIHANANTVNQGYQFKPVSSWALRGHLQGFAQPCVRLLLHFIPQADKQSVSELRTEYPELVPENNALPVRLSDHLARAENVGQIAAPVLPLLHKLVSFLVQLQETSGWPICLGAVVEHVGISDNDVPGSLAVALVVPSFNPALLLKVLPWVFSTFAAEFSVAEDTNNPKTLANVLAMLKLAAPAGMNTRHFLMASYNLAVPAQRLAGQVMQYGWGSQAHWMDSSFTDSSSGISAQIARNKVSTHMLLMRAGLPVPEQLVVLTLDAAVQAANRIGYPVVIKPADLDGGKGVEAGLQDESALKMAYARAATYSKNLILESNIKGKDYRLGVVHGQLAWASYREPAGVTGNGIATLEALIAEANRNPNRGTESWSEMSPIRIDAEANELLEEQGFKLSAVPVDGCFVKLRRSANISSGGRPADVTELVHPDNVALALRAARTIRLDIAGIDFIMPDITRSWREVGGAICEINGQPQFSFTRRQAYAEAISGLVQGDGRIPVVLLLFNAGWGHWTSHVLEKLLSAGINPGFVLKDDVFIGKDRISFKRSTTFDHVQVVLLDSEVDAVFVATDGKDWLRNGSAVDRVDLIIADDSTDRQVLQAMSSMSANGVWKLNAPLMADSKATLPWLQRLIELVVQQSKAHLAAAGNHLTV